VNSQSAAIFFEAVSKPQVQGSRYLAGFHIYFYQNYGVQQAQADRESAVPPQAGPH